MKAVLELIDKHKIKFWMLQVFTRINKENNKNAARSSLAHVARRTVSGVGCDIFLSGKTEVVKFVQTLLFTRIRAI